jgi:hypothetical protein
VYIFNLVGGKSPCVRWGMKVETLIMLVRDPFDVERGHLEVTPVDIGSLPRPAERAVDAINIQTEVRQNSDVNVFW